MNKEKILAVALTAMVMTATQTACGDGDNSGSSTPAPALTDKAGNKIQVSRISGSDSNFSFVYDDLGRLTSVGGYEVEGGKLTFTEGSHSKYEISFNGSGLMSKAVYTYDEAYGSGSYERHNATMNMTYSGHRLSGGSATASFSSYYAPTGERDETTGTATLRLTWSGDNLAKVVYKSSERGTEDGERYSSSSSGEYTLSYGDQENAFRQMPYFLGYELIDLGGLGGALAAGGMIGTGPKNLPTGFVCEEIVDGEVDTYTSTLRYTLNSDGSIRTETRGSSWTVTYTYNDLTTRAAEVEQAKAVVAGLKDAFARMRRHHSK